MGGQLVAEGVELLGQVQVGGGFEVVEGGADGGVVGAHLVGESAELVAVAFGQGQEDFFFPAEVGAEKVVEARQGVGALLGGRSGHIGVGGHIVLEHLGQDEQVVVLARQGNEGFVSFHSGKVRLFSGKSVRGWWNSVAGTFRSNALLIRQAENI